MPLVKTQAEGINLADTFAFTGTVSGAGGVSNLQIFRVNQQITATTTPTTITDWTDAHNTSGFKRVGTAWTVSCLLYTSPSPRDLSTSRMPSSA